MSYIIRRPAWVTSTVLLIGVLVVGFWALTDHGIRSTLDQPRVTVGKTFTLTTQFANTWPSIPKRGGQVRIVDGRGTNWLLPRDMIQDSRAGFADQTAGVFDDCPLGLGPTVGRPPLRSSTKEIFLVLSETPVGRYTVHVPAQRFCGMDVSNPPATLEIMVVR
jgi:hypothetical protein